LENKFEVHLANFDGPFDLLLSLISKHKLDVTHISIGQVTDEFIAYVKTLSEDHQKLDEISQFILIAATLLEIKAARLLPGNKDFSDEDLELLEARDLLFAKILQYKAFKDVAFDFMQKIEAHHGRMHREVPLEQKFKELLPQLIWKTDKIELAKHATNAFSIYQLRNSGVDLHHIHMRQVNVAQQGAYICQKLQTKKVITFDQLIQDAKYPQIIIGRFLSLLELYKMNAVEFVQKKALSTLTIKWVAEADFDYQKRLEKIDQYENR
jgi:segregation and condensation protein A